MLPPSLKHAVIGSLLVVTKWPELFKEDSQWCSPSDPAKQLGSLPRTVINGVARVLNVLGFSERRIQKTKKFLINIVLRTKDFVKENEVLSDVIVVGVLIYQTAVICNPSLAAFGTSSLFIAGSLLGITPPEDAPVPPEYRETPTSSGSSWTEWIKWAWNHVVQFGENVVDAFRAPIIR